MRGWEERLRILHSVRHLRPRQILHRLLPRRRLPASMSPPPRYRPSVRRPVTPPRRQPSLLAPTTFHFLHETRCLRLPGDWCRTDGTLLWWYNLHYFDDLNAEGAENRRDEHQGLICRWIREVESGTGVGWDPYPLSVRIRNWVFWMLAGDPPSAEICASLVQQVRFLRRNVEWRHMGNHLFANAKALLLAGAVFEGEEAAQWRRAGWDVLDGQMRDQIMPDGGHFERSPMYHLLVLEDLLDIVNVLRACEFEEASRMAGLLDTAQSMLQWARVVRHPDGEIPLFNDAALKVAPSPTELDRYAEALSISLDDDRGPRVVSHEPAGTDSCWLADSGYVRGRTPRAAVLLDVAPLGPDWIPGHGHADTLTFELSLDGRRMITDSGTSTYDPGSVRDVERGTAAHNTVVVDGKDSSEVWGGFRVGRRARVLDCDVSWENESLHVRASHDGYRRLRPGVQHTRSWELGADGLRVLDRLEGRGWHDITVYLHFHPDCTVEAVGGSEGSVWCICRKGLLSPARLELMPPLGARLLDGYYASEFGLRMPSPFVEARWSGQLPVTLTTAISW
jgi:uncharacterized heparinase superfamily protein